ncbi:RfbB dTDP-D-glucose 4,6-dehydratase [uncultured Caudovirales phage]|uniref:RfbB dTDP-D-glucose 4,6-dehydratase n=1 Tax=uncultured Caudovirales phage TaxID=2100421 RepID=A0A6J5LJR4_9CAUD|nr:RfbB dTDP-D-glucose 4,6-dehydratase [uncultured Caudovirales phage]
MIIVTGGAGFIGGNYLRSLKKMGHKKVVCVDKLTYASNYEYIKDLVDEGFVEFRKKDITNYYDVEDVFMEFDPTYIVHFAAESHVDNSINNYIPFVHTNIMGTLNLLEQCRKLKNLKKFIHVSTDEVYGSLELDEDRSFNEKSHYETNSPYSASKAASDCFARAFYKTYGVPVIITNCSNNYGPNQHDEKLIPTIIRKALADEKIPVYGDGMNVRDWLYVDDHCNGINLVLKYGKVGEKYNIGGGQELPNIELVRILLKKLGKPESLIKFVKDRAGHDRKYSIDCSKIQKELGYKPNYTLDEALDLTIDYYLAKEFK